MTMIRSLRSSCIIKLNRMKKEDMGLEIPDDIPQELFMDLMLADLCNGTFQAVAERRTRKVNVTYDGAWTLSANTLATSFLGIPATLKLCKYRLEKNPTVGAPIFNMESLLDMTKDHGQDLPPEDQVTRTRMEVKVNTEDWRWARLEVIGTVFKFNWTINKNLDGSRTLTHHGVAKSDGDTNVQEFFITSLPLEETSEDMEI